MNDLKYTFEHPSSGSGATTNQSLVGLQLGFSAFESLLSSPYIDGRLRIQKNIVTKTALKYSLEDKFRLVSSQCDRSVGPFII